MDELQKSTHRRQPLAGGVDPKLAGRAAHCLDRVIVVHEGHPALGAIVSPLVLLFAGVTQPHLGVPSEQ